jgi:hypothetical protein
MNAGTIAGLVLLVIGGALMIGADPAEPGRWSRRNVALAVLVLATIVYLGGRIAMLVRNPRG